ncbi:patatin phospholipase [Aspergillus lentulus]|nr:patatin phospholipase [Aspergillus lentulus]
MMLVSLIPIFRKRSENNVISLMLVVAATIAKEIKSFVFGNFNAVDWFSKEYSKKISKNSYFSTVYLYNIGTFQDGGLQDNFAVGIAQQISCWIWPSRPGIV